MRRFNAVLCVLIGLGISAVLLALVLAPTAPHVPAGPQPIQEHQIGLLCGWAGEDIAAEEIAKRQGKIVRFMLADRPAHVADASKKKVCLWDAAKLVNDGRHIPSFRQEIGDCVSMGAANACQYLLAVQIAVNGSAQDWHPIFPPFIYGTSRIQIGKNLLGNSDGSVGIWAAEAMQKFGVLNSDRENCPPYSEAVATTWGRKPGPPKKWFPIAAKQLVKSFAQVQSWDEVRDAIQNGYPVTVASDQGFAMKQSLDRGKMWGVARGVWKHQMCFIGVDPDPKRPGAYLINSWGPDAHSAPAGDEPPGGFWVDAKVVDRMVKQNDSFAISELDGFPKRELDWDILIIKRKAAKAQAAIKPKKESPLAIAP